MAYLSTENAIPAMTGDIQPIGKASASSFINRADPWKAFNRIQDVNGWTVNSSTNSWIMYEFPTAKIIRKYSIKSDAYPLRAPTSWTFEGSNDGVHFTVLDSRENIKPWTIYDTKSFEVTNNRYYKMYRVNIRANNSDTGATSIDQIEMFEYVHDYRYLISTDPGKYYSLQYQNETEIPYMKSPTSPSGEATASSAYNSSREPWHAFDGNSNTSWASNKAVGWLQYRFTELKKIKKYSILITGTSGRSPIRWTFEASLDGSTWDILDDQSNIDWGSQKYKEFVIPNEKYYSIYRLNVTKNSGSNSTLEIAELKMSENIDWLICIPFQRDDIHSKFGLTKNMVVDFNSELSGKKRIVHDAQSVGSGKIFRLTLTDKVTSIKVE
ncbi:discoidin domain-containing protein [Paenibacillus sp. MER 180]|uniref:discoidin domain-containing protein n=1 Tax=Paenibacillus sp. MER 180 TaxID=2939570 RepID=UPI00203C8E99|nr:discoidin domain-containing protein [Paenibacillus sp. MER 180]MCM3289893.1 discoidin domain-containing protein [Paenibacillus sp. MER 180]